MVPGIFRQVGDCVCPGAKIFQVRLPDENI